MAKPPAPRLLPDGGTVLITGSGPSLTQADVTYARKHVALTICVNDSYLYAPDAEALYGGDGSWWVNHQMCRAPHTYQGRKFPAFTGRLRCSMSSITGTVNEPDVMVFRQGPQMGLSLDPMKLATGKNSVFAAINLAVHLGGTAAWLLGVDMQPGKVFRDGALRQTDHFWGRHPMDAKPPYELCIQRFATLVEPLAKIGFQVVNCTPGSALRCFPMKSVTEVCQSVTAAVPA